MARQDSVICHHRVTRGREREFEALLARHWPTLDALGLAVAEPSRIYRGEEENGPIYDEILSWRDGEKHARGP